MTLYYAAREGTGPAVIALRGLGSSRANEVASEIFDWSLAIRPEHRLVSYDARADHRDMYPQMAATVEVPRRSGTEGCGCGSALHGVH